MADTASTAFAAAVQVALQSTVLKNLRDKLVWADPSLSEHGTFDKATDQLMFLTYPDLSITTPLTPLTEGTPPTARVITMENVRVGTSQYGDLVSVTDIAKVKAPNDIISIASERVTRVAAEVIDRVMRTAIFTGGTAYYTSVDHTTRATIDNTDFITGLDILKMRATAKKRNIPTFGDGTYHVYLAPGQVYDLKAETTDDTGWADLNKYDNSAEVRNDSIGVFHGCRIYEVNRAPTFSSTVTVTGGLLLGDIKGWGCGDLQTLKAYHISGVDFGNPLDQLERVGFKVMFGCAPLNNTYYMRIEGYATAIS